MSIAEHAMRAFSFANPRKFAVEALTLSKAMSEVCCNPLCSRGQVAPLTDRVAEILDEIEMERKQSKVRNVHGLVFTRDNGKPINKDAITGTLRRACRDAK